VFRVGTIPPCPANHARPPGSPSNFFRILPPHTVPFSPTIHCRKSFSCNTYGFPRKRCKQKTYARTKPFRCNTYKKTGGWGVLLLTSSLCFPTFKRAFNRPLFSIASTLFHFPYPVTPLLACPPWRATPTKTAGCVPTISILELNLEICPGQSLLLFIFHQSPVTIYQSQVAHPPVPNGTGRRPLPYAYNYSAILPSSRSGGSLVPVSWRSS